MPGVGVGQAALLVVIEAEEQGGVLLRLRGPVEMTIQEPEHLRRRGSDSDNARGPRGQAHVRSISGGRAGPHRSHLLLLVGADRGMDGGHEQGRGDAFAADVPHGDPHLLRAVGEEVIVVAADDARRAAGAVELQSAGAAAGLREELGLDLVGDLQFALQALFLLLLLDQPLQRLGHGIEGGLQRAKLVFMAHLDAMGEVATVDVFGRLVEVGDRISDGAGQTYADDPRDQHHDAEGDRQDRKDGGQDFRVLAHGAG